MSSDSASSASKKCHLHYSNAAGLCGKSSQDRDHPSDDRLRQWRPLREMPFDTIASIFWLLNSHRFTDTGRSNNLVVSLACFADTCVIHNVLSVDQYNRLERIAALIASPERIKKNQSPVGGGYHPSLDAPLRYTSRSLSSVFGAGSFSMYLTQLPSTKRTCCGGA